MNVGQLDFLLNLETRSFYSSMDEAESRGKGLGDILAGALSVTIGGALLEGLNLIKDTLGDAVKKGMEFSSNMSEVAALGEIDMSSSVFTQLRDQVMQLGADSKFTSAEVASGASVMAAAGLDTQQIMAGLPGLVSLASVENMSFAESSDIAVSAMTGFRLGADQLTRVADVLTKTSADSNVSVKTLGQSMKYISPVAGQLGLDFNDVNAALGILGNVGIKGSQAGRNLASGLMFLAGPSSKAAVLMDELNIKVTDANGNFKQLPDVIDSLSKAFSGMSNAQQVAALNTLVGKDNMKTWLPLIHAGKDGIDKFSDSLEHSQGAAAEMAKKKMDNLSGSIEYFTGALETVTTKSFIQFENGAKEIVNVGTALLGIFGPRFNEMTAKLAVYFNIAATALGGFATTTDRIGYAKDLLYSLFFQISRYIQAQLPIWIATLEQWGYTAWGWIEIAADSAYTKLIEYKNILINWATINYPLWLQALEGWGLALWGWVADASILAYQKIVEYGQSLFNWAMTNYPSWIATLEQWGIGIWQWIVNAVPLALSTLLEWRNQLINFVLTNLPSWIDTLAQWSITLVGWITAALPDALAGFTHYTVELIGMIGNALPGIIDKLSYYSIALLDWITSSSPGATSELGGYVGQIVDAIGNALPGIVNSLGKWAGALVEWIIDAAPKLLDNLISLVNNLGIWIGERIPIIAGYLATWIDAFAAWVPIIWPKLDIAFQGMMTKIINWVGDKGPIVLEKLGEWGLAFVGWVAPYIPKVIQALFELLYSVSNWVINNQQSITDKLSEWATAFAGWIQDKAIPYLRRELPKLWLTIKQWISDRVAEASADGSLGAALVDGIRLGWEGLKVLATNVGMSIKDKILEWTGALKDAGTALIDNLWNGISERFNRLMADMGNRLQDLRNLLPGSEPKDTSSPLFGLGQSGQALIENFQSGINGAQLTLAPQLNTLSNQISSTANAPIASPVISTASAATPITININNPSAGTDIRSIEEAGYRGAQRALKEEGKSAELRGRTK
jgi:TP901 family phage tail tape measure protein